eukprot:m.137764 g.137764  ORF g.137764 m.137764 type:complete len:112 (-) comp15900_c0_seq7:1188-1523(-)
MVTWQLHSRQHYKFACVLANARLDIVCGNTTRFYNENNALSPADRIPRILALRETALQAYQCYKSLQALWLVCEGSRRLDETLSSVDTRQWIANPPCQQPVHVHAVLAPAQ